MECVDHERQMTILELDRVSHLTGTSTILSLLLRR